MLQRLLGIGGVRKQRYAVTLSCPVYYNLTTKLDIKINTRDVYAILKHLGHRPRKVTTTLHRDWYISEWGHIVSKCTLRLNDDLAATDLKEKLEAYAAMLTEITVLPTEGELT